MSRIRLCIFSLKNETPGQGWWQPEWSHTWFSACHSPIPPSFGASWKPVFPHTAWCTEPAVPEPQPAHSINHLSAIYEKRIKHQGVLNSCSQIRSSGFQQTFVLSGVRLFVTPWTVAHQAPLSTGIFRQEYWSGLPFPSPGEADSPELKMDSLPTESPGEPMSYYIHIWTSLSRVWLFVTPGQNTGVGSHSLLQGIFPTQGLNPGLLHCRWILYQLPAAKPKNTGVRSLSLLQQIFPTQELNQGLLHCRQILYQLSYQGSPGLTI